MRRAMRVLRGGETENLSQNYWTAKAVTINKKSSDEDLFDCRQNIVPLLNEDELVYLYWELVHFNKNRNTLGHAIIMREYLLNEYMDRKYQRGEHKS